MMRAFPRDMVEVPPQGRHVAYAELQAVSNFSFLRGASHAEELVERAADLGSPPSASPTATPSPARCAPMSQRRLSQRRRRACDC